MDNTFTFLAGGRLGDLFHELYVIFIIYKTSGKKGKLYITDENSIDSAVVPFGNGEHNNVSHTYHALKSIILQQECIESFHLYQRGDPIPSGFVSLNKWRRHNISTHWLNFLKEFYNLPTDENIQWIKPIISSDMNFLKNKVLIHRSIVPHRINQHFPLENIITKNDCIFISTDPNEYYNFKYKDSVPFLHLNDLSEMMTAIASCKFFIGNQSSPLALAWGMQVHFLAEINIIEKKFYQHPQINWYLDSSNYNFIDLHKFIKL